jgi:hypothetical protein
MAGQLTALGAQSLVNAVGGIVPPHIGTTAPTWQPGLYWINTTAGAVLEYWNGSAWVAGTEPLYIALLTGDPSVSGPGGGYALNISDLIEDTTSGYARQAVTFAAPVPYLSATTYTSGQKVIYQEFVYQCAVGSISGTAPSGTATNNTDWTYIGPAYPASAANSNTLTFSYSAAQPFPVQWAALVTASTGTTGLLKYLWTLPQPQQVAGSQSIQIGAGMAALMQA